MNTRTARHLAYVAAAFGVDEAAILGHGRVAKVASARQVLYWLLRRDGMSFTQIGALMGRHHTSVIAGVDLVDANPVLRAVGWATPVIPNSQTLAGDNPRARNGLLAPRWENETSPRGAATPGAGSDRQPANPGRG